MEQGHHSPSSDIKALLGEPYYEGPSCLIYNMDCVEAMRTLCAPGSSKGFVDLAVTSPPYNIGKEYETPLPLAEYLKWSEEWIDLVHRLSKEDGAFWLNLGYVSVPNKGKAVPLPYLLFDRVPFFLIQEVVWNYGAGVACKKQLSPRNEKFLWYVKNEDRYTFNLDAIRDTNVKYPNQRKNGVLRCNPKGTECVRRTKLNASASGKNPSDVWAIPKVTSGSGRASRERTSHPAQFPVAVIERIVNASSDRGDIVLDPFLGSGTTAEVAVRLGRFFLGFEVERSYCDIAVKRVNAAYRTLRTPNLRTFFGESEAKRKREVKEDEKKGEKELKRRKDS